MTEKIKEEWGYDCVDEYYYYWGEFLTEEDVEYIESMLEEIEHAETEEERLNLYTKVIDKVLEEVFIDSLKEKNYQVLDYYRADKEDGFWYTIAEVVDLGI